MKSSTYWQKRSEQLHNEQFRKTDKYIDTTLKREYDRATASIQRDIEVFYHRFAVNNELSLADARKLLNSDQLKEFKMSLEEFTELAKNNPDGRWTQLLNNVYYKVRVTRLQALQIQIEAAIQAVNMKQNEQMTGLLDDIYKDTYYRTIFEIQKGLGIGASFAKVDDAKRIVQQPWLEENFSKRIWKDNAKLIQQLQTQFTQAIIRGDSTDFTAKVIAERMGVGYRATQRLVRTEASHIQNEASFNAYRASGVVQKYEFLATLDSRTSSICRAMDNHVFTLAEKEIGVNFPPLHSNCRSTTVPYFDDEIDPGERIARDSRGTYYVTGNMSYNQWLDEHVK
ncbi:minor capsid protein [Brevibacillus borstelensis]|uniref:minor capsid protein n=1 Tax=Brevibacillus borstelensis TaxID=45462 RepID=UPI0030BAFE82